MLYKIPKGKLLIIGGREDKGDYSFMSEEWRLRQIKRLEILSLLIPKNKRGKKGIEIITTGSSEPYDIAKVYKVETSDTKSAMKDYDYAIGLNQNRPDYYLQRGKLKTLLNQPHSACLDFKKYASLGWR